jgi:hypothetical protein
MGGSDVLRCLLFVDCAAHAATCDDGSEQDDRDARSCREVQEREDREVVAAEASGRADRFTGTARGHDRTASATKFCVHKSVGKLADKFSDVNKLIVRIDLFKNDGLVVEERIEEACASGRFNRADTASASTSRSSRLGSGCFRGLGGGLADCLEAELAIAG